MDLENFSFSLPEELIAKWPLADRTQSKLLVLDKKTGKLEEDVFKNLCDFINNEYFMVLNNTKVDKARIFGKKATGGKVEILLLEKYNEYEYSALTKGKVNDNEAIYINDVLVAHIVKENSEKLCRVIFNGFTGEDVMEKFGTIPIPPYLKRSTEDMDYDYYQTVYAKIPGSIAAPTAGLHFNEKLIAQLKEHGIQMLEVTLNVSYATFNPIKEKDINDHIMHSESYYIDNVTKDKINSLKKSGKKLLAVGTTVVRALEDAADESGLIAKEGITETSLYIKPGYKFKIVDALITNFHLPKSSLFILVSAFCGLDYLKSAYNYATSNSYRFYSYGDGMLIK
jgi:S-adenosylmethionine:tRNA ribosyltransferase-isomerase